MNEEYRDNEYDDDLVRCSFVPKLLGILLLVAVVFVGILSYNIYKTMLDVYEDEVQVSSLNRQYMRVIEKWDKSDTSYIMSPLATDLSITDLVDSSDSNMFVQASSARLFNRGYKSFDESVEWIRSISKAENIENVAGNIMSDEELSELVRSSFNAKLEIPEGTFKDSDLVSIVKLPNKLEGNVLESASNLYFTGVYYEDGGRYKIEFDDGKHEIVFYKGSYDYEQDWQKKEGTVEIPKALFSTASSTNQTLSGLIKDFECNTSQVLVYDLVADDAIKNATPEHDAKVTVPYNFVILNKATGIIVAGGVVKE